MLEEKVFGIGFQKTGTSSLGVILKRLGYQVAGYQQFSHFAAREGVTLDELEEHALELARRYDAAKDTPWPLFYRSLDTAFPGAKFIHVTRDREAWIRSAVGDFADHPNMIHQAIYGVPYPKGHEEIWLERYDRHNRDVAAYFADRPGDYLHVRLEDGLTYEAVCRFLGHDVIAADMPVANTRWKKRVKTVLRRAGFQV